jgi:hypothetical protein
LEKATEIAKVSRASGIGDFGKSGHENYIARERESVPILDRRFTEVVRPTPEGGEGAEEASIMGVGLIKKMGIEV